jgi:hypothetical protein
MNQKKRCTSKVFTFWSQTAVDSSSEMYLDKFPPVISNHSRNVKAVGTGDVTACTVELGVSPCCCFPLFSFAKKSPLFPSRNHPIITTVFSPFRRPTIKNVTLPQYTSSYDAGQSKHASEPASSPTTEFCRLFLCQNIQVPSCSWATNIPSILSCFFIPLPSSSVGIPRAVRLLRSQS